MSVTITWLPSQESDIASYRVEEAAAVSGPWVLVADVVHDLQDLVDGMFVYVDSNGTGSTWYRITAVDLANQSGAPSQPFRASTEATALLPSLIGVVSITAGDVGTLLNLGFTHIEVWRSDDESATWYEVTEAAYVAASVTSLAARALVEIGGTPRATFAIGGTKLRFRYQDAAIHEVEFPSHIPNWTPQQVADRINQVVAASASVSGSTVVLSSLTAGRAYTVQVVESPTALGFSTDIAYGKDPRIALQDAVLIYTYYDPISASYARYKWRFSANSNPPVSRFSKWVSPRSTAVQPQGLSVATAKFVTVDGRPSRARVIVAAESGSIAGYVISAGDTYVYEADENGLVQFNVIQGARIRVALEGTGIIRVITVPTTPTFDLLQAMSDAPDEFTMQETVPILTKRSI